MKSSGWSSLLLGSALAGLAVGVAFAEDAGEATGATARHRVSVEVDRTGSIAPLTAVPDRSGLSPVAPRAPEALHPVPAATEHAAPASATTPATAAAPAPTTPAVEGPTAAPSAVAEPAPAVVAPAALVAPAPAEPAPTATAPLAPATPAAAPAPTATAPAAAGPAPTAAAPVAPATPEVVTTTPTRSPTPVVAPTGAATGPTSTDAEVAASLEAQQVADALEKTARTEVARGGASYERSERAALADFYRSRGWRPYFVGTQDLTAEGRTLARVLSESARDGLEPTDYALPQHRAATPEARAEAEFAVAETALRYVRQLASGRFDPGRLSDLVTPRPPRPDPAEVLRGFSASHDLAATLAAWAPPQEGYRRLRDELARLRAQHDATPVVRLPEGPLLAPGQKDERVALLRERLGVVASDADPDTYDPALAEAVKTFQRERGIAASGKIGRTTVAALNEEAHGPADRVADVIVNMERWRWLPRDLGELHVFVNIPDFHLDVVKDGRSIHHARVITGRPENQTPIFSETMEYVVVNPYWNVPQSIVKKEMMAKLQSGGTLGQSYEVEVGDREVDPGSVDWTSVSASQVSIRQRPGDGNALGNIKFMFPNQHAVYIHDTSSRGLFGRDYRALSHGCVRVAEPFSFADALLSEEPTGLDGTKLKKMLGRGEQQINLKRRIPVHITYFTEFVDDAGQLQSRRDVYGHDAKMRRILGL